MVLSAKDGAPRYLSVILREGSAFPLPLCGACPVVGCGPVVPSQVKFTFAQKLK
jgi:hypothetical protein